MEPDHSFSVQPASPSTSPVVCPSTFSVMGHPTSYMEHPFRWATIHRCGQHRPILQPGYPCYHAFLVSAVNGQCFASIGALAYLSVNQTNTWAWRPWHSGSVTLHRASRCLHKNPLSSPATVKALVAWISSSHGPLTLLAGHRHGSSPLLQRRL